MSSESYQVIKNILEKKHVILKFKQNMINTIKYGYKAVNAFTILFFSLSCIIKRMRGNLYSPIIHMAKNIVYLKSAIAEKKRISFNESDFQGKDGKIIHSFLNR